MTKRLCRFWSWGLLASLLWLVTPVLYAQTPVNIDTTTLGALTSAAPTARFTFRGEAGEGIRIELISVTEGLTLRGFLFTPQSTFLAALGDQAPTSTPRTDLTLPETGIYMLEVNSSNGRLGEFVLRLSSRTLSDSCATLVYDTLNAVERFCDITGRNQACYGNVQIDAVPIPGAPPLRFEQVGDIVDLALIDSFVLSPYDAAMDRWGVAFLRVQANLPDSIPGQNVTMLFVGDVQVVNRSSAVAPLADRYRPMQAFYFTTGVGASQCQDVQDSGVLIDTPAGVGFLDFEINEVRVSLGSTAFIRLSEDSTLDVELVQGLALVEAQGQAQTMIGGQRVRVPVSEEGLPIAPPLPPEPLPDEDLARIPDPERFVPPDLGPAPTPFQITTPAPGQPTPDSRTGACAAAPSNVAVNVRSGPGTEYPTVGGLDLGQSAPVVGRNQNASWYAIAYRNEPNAWLAASVVNLSGDCSNVPLLRIPPTPTPPFTPTPLASPTPVYLDNDSYRVQVDLERLGTQHALSGQLSALNNDLQDTVTYELLNLGTRLSIFHVLTIEYRCDARGAETIRLHLPGGRIDAPCTTQWQQWRPFSQQTQETITILLGAGGGGTWELRLSVVEQQGS